MNYSKAVAMVVATVVAAVVSALTDGTMTDVEWINVAVVGVGAAGVFAAENTPTAQYTKVVLAVLTAVLVGLASFISDGVSTAELLQLLIAALGAAGVYAAPYTNAALRSPDQGMRAA